METRRFPLAVVLSVTTGRLVCELDQVYGILNFLTGDNLMTHALPRARRTVAPVLLERFPDLALARPERLDELLAGVQDGDRMAACRTWVAEMTLLCGEFFDLMPLVGYRHMDPVQELTHMGVDPKKIIVTG